jgi:hypothetical protein
MAYEIQERRILGVFLSHEDHGDIWGDEHTYRRQLQRLE